MTSVQSAPEFDATLMLTNATQKACGQIATDFSVSVVHALAKKFGFDADSAIRDLGLEQISVKSSSKAKKSKSLKEVKPPRDMPKILIPWTGTGLGSDFCHGLRLNHGLHTQCYMASIGDEIYCKTCQRQADKNATGKPTYGNIESRATAGILEFRDPKDNKQTIPYANVMEKLGVTREQVEAEASRFGLEIPEEHFVKREARRGRPATKPTADSDGSDTNPKKRGRPKKEKKVIESSVGDDLIASLVAQSKASDNSDSDKSDSGDETKAAITKPKTTKPKTTKPKKPELSDEEKAAKKLAAGEKRKEAAALKRSEKIKAKKAAEIAAMKAKMLAMQKEMEEATDKMKTEVGTEKPLSSEQELEIEEVLELEIEQVQSPSPVAEPVAPIKTEVTKEKSPEVLEVAPPDVFDADTEDDEGEDEEEIKVAKFEHDGKTYLKASDNMLYDPSTSECVGMWNPASKEIEEVVEFGSDDESDDEE